MAIQERTLKNLSTEGINCKNVTALINSGGKIPAKSRKNIPSEIRKNREITTLSLFNCLFVMS
jgi:hypothetical protein